MLREAHIDQGGQYRYALRRVWDPGGRRLCCVLLNPSRADAQEDDPTLRRVVGFAQAWGYGSVEVVNLFALRSPSPAALRGHPDPIGPGTPAAQRRALGRADAVLLGWGGGGQKTVARARFLARLERLRTKRPRLRVLALARTGAGEPVHPLYQPADGQPCAWPRMGDRGTT